MLSRAVLIILSLVALCAGANSVAAETNTLFERPAELERDIAFWRRVYTEVTTQGGFIHDPERLDVVYEVLQFSSETSPRARSTKIEEAKKKYARILERLATGTEDLTEEERRVLDLWPKGTRRARFEQAAEEVRFQLGQADRFREGLIRSGAWRDEIAATFERMGLPRELSALPHVESSFNPYAYSKVGAAGMWQFMRSTGRRFLRIDAVVDERLDHYRSTAAAARFLEQNYLILGSWPLALTAYNHGPGGMRRAKEQLGTDDIATIVRKYNSRTFGFASRNFYVAFLAALEVDSAPEQHFGQLRRDPPDNSRPFELPQPIAAPRLAAALDLDRDALKRINPSLLPAVWNGARPIPRGFEFRVPAHVDLTAALGKLAAEAPREVLLADAQHRVRSGETLSVIATRYGVNMLAIAELNNLQRPYQIRVGQILDLPGKSEGAPKVAKAEPAPIPVPATPATGVAEAQERYVVRRGDTLSKIATRHGMTEDALMSLNNIRNRNFLYEGQVLALASAARVAPPVEAEVPVEPAVLPITERVAVSVAEASEPESEKEAEALGPALVPGTQAAVSADPSDYSVHEDQTIRVQATETLGHYAEWLDVRASQLRKLNRMSNATPVVVGRSIKLDFSKVSPDQFEAKWQEYHRQLQEAFFTQYRIRDNATHVICSGESIWVLAQQRYNVPIWLLRQYNPDVDLGALKAGMKLIIPLVEPAAAADAGASS